MSRRHFPQAWLLTDERMGAGLWRVLRTVPRGGGLVVRHLSEPHRPHLLRRIRRLARSRDLLLLDEAEGSVARVHDMRELRRALGRRTPLIFISPLFPTRSHPGRKPLGRMRAATLARLAGGRAHALGGMDAGRFADVRRLGFAGWGGVDAWLEGKAPSRE